ncbi:hypothetical protein CKO42_11445 [Lamprobacter modestohalophilus]|uniref:Alpha/beta hydrolase n=1 Tax=Lamprobacter modestohalophilus TaxID=1064514 RepID=A0A9X1B4H1_9GAMM|nr:alpha/beta hydrolase [Lamprobacter modestohalophilus]MBK1619034.1 hypothetical protein [Lamprobacter modestohalophilus]
MPGLLTKTLILLLSSAIISGCASTARELMPTPVVYQQPGGKPLFDPERQTQRQPDVDLLYITDRAQPTPEEVERAKAAGEALPYGQERARRIAFGSAQVRLVPAIDWQGLAEQSQLAERTRPVELELGRVKELGAFPDEPYQIKRNPQGLLLRDRHELARHAAAREALQDEIRRRLEGSPTGEVMLYVHGFNETFANAAFTTAELCHFLGREPVCSFFTWPASTTGNFLISYTNTTETADFAVAHLKKTIRTIATMPEVKGMHVLAHSRGAAVTLSAARELVLEAIAAGKEPASLFKVKNLVLMSPDIDIDIASQQLTGFISDPDLVTVWPEARLPRTLDGRLTVYSSPKDRALQVSRILFRSRTRVGQLTPDKIPDTAQRYLETRGGTDLIAYEGKRTDLFGHGYFTTNPRVSSDLVQLIRFGKKPGDPGRELIRTGRVTWRIPSEGETGIEADGSVVAD